MNETETYTFQPVGFIHSCFQEKFGIPRQPGLVREARATLELQGAFRQPEALRELENFSHIWLSFIFHKVPQGNWRATVRPPRLGGNHRVGVFASRSPFRPNRLGLSVVELERIEDCTLHLAGVDLLDGTPIVDIKPYVPYSDAIPEARAGFAPQAPAPVLEVQVSEAAEAAFAKRNDKGELRALARELIALDPRPATRKDENRIFGFRLKNADIRWRVRGRVAEILEVRQ